MRTRIRAVAALTTFVTAVGCYEEPPAEPEIDSTDSALIAGVRAPGKSLDAVGTIGVIDEYSGRYEFFCTATLIAPKLVLTAKHCAMMLGGPFAGMKLVNMEKIVFAVGADARAPRKTVEAIASDLSPIDDGGTLGLGNDVATYHLKEAITDVTPIPVAESGFASGDIGKRYLGVGFGSRDALQDLTGRGPLERRAGTMTLRALEGKPVQTIFKTFENFVDELQNAGFFAPPFVIQEMWESSLIPGYEAWVGKGSTETGADGVTDAQTCHGDSGGPLLIPGAKRAILGVVSGGYFSRQLTCDHGTFYATFGPLTRQMLAIAATYTDPCATVTTKGACEGTVATRCTGKFEGDRRVVRQDCADLGMVCGQGRDGVVACLDEGQPEAPATPVVPPGPTTPGPGAPPKPTVEDFRAQVRAVEAGLLRPTPTGQLSE